MDPAPRIQLVGGKLQALLLALLLVGGLSCASQSPMEATGAEFDRSPVAEETVACQEQIGDLGQTVLYLDRFESLSSWARPDVTIALVAVLDEGGDGPEFGGAFSPEERAEMDGSRVVFRSLTLGVIEVVRGDLVAEGEEITVIDSGTVAIDEDGEMLARSGCRALEVGNRVLVPLLLDGHGTMIIPAPNAYLTVSLEGLIQESERRFGDLPPLEGMTYSEARTRILEGVYEPPPTPVLPDLLPTATEHASQPTPTTEPT